MVTKFSEEFAILCLKSIENFVGVAWMPWMPHPLSKIVQIHMPHTVVPTCKKCVKSLFLNLCGKTYSQWFSSAFLTMESNWFLISLYFNLLLKFISKLRKLLVVPSFTLDIFSSIRHEIDKNLVSRLNFNWISSYVSKVLKCLNQCFARF